MMDRIARRMEKSLDYKEMFDCRSVKGTKDVTEAIGEAAVNLASDLHLPAIITAHSAARPLGL